MRPHQFSERFDIPEPIAALVHQGILTDSSWGNDAMPHLDVTVRSEREGVAALNLEVWCDAVNQMDGEFWETPVEEWYRFSVILHEEDGTRPFETLLRTNDPALVVAVVMEQRTRWGVL